MYFHTSFYVLKLQITLFRIYIIIVYIVCLTIDVLT